MTGLERTLEVVSEIDRITRLHEQYKEGSRTPKLPSPEDLQRGLFGIIQNYAPVESRIAEGAAKIHTALIQRNDPAFLPYLGNALVLTEQSQSGKSNEIAFQDTVRYLLAKGDYTPVRTESYQEGSFHFYTDTKGTKVAAISEKGCRFYSAMLKSEFYLDELVDDFVNLKEGRNKKVVEAEDSFKKNTAEYGLVAFMAGFVASLGGIFNTPAYQLLDSNPLFVLGISFFIGGPLGLYAGTYTGKKILAQISTRKLRQELPKFPHHNLTKSMYAILDAFPLTKTVIVEH